MGRRALALPMRLYGTITGLAAATTLPAPGTGDVPHEPLVLPRSYSVPESLVLAVDEPGGTSTPQASAPHLHG